MVIDFPALCPIGRQAKPGLYPVKRFTSVSGAGTTRLFGNKAFDATLQLRYEANDDEAARMVQSYHDSLGGFHPLQLPGKVWEGMSDDLRKQFPDHLTWRWAQEPEVESVQPGRTRLAVSLVGTLD
jgi:hypothetical protein